jgi:DNA ligase (NAD+)
MSNSPTQTVGYTISKGLKKVVHSHKMLSLEKTKSISDLKNFINKEDCIGDCIMSLKMDGLTILLTYENGKLVRGETRGDSIEGQLVTEAIKHFDNVPLSIPFNDYFEIEGEAIITYEDFNQINTNGNYQNPRNLASGTLALLDTKEIAKRHLKFIAWKVPTNIASTYTERFKIAKNFGFTVVPYLIVNNNIEEIIRTLKKDAEKLFYPIDGLVISYNNIEYGLSLGETTHAPRHSLAYKFYDEEYGTTLLDIDYDISRNGILTPVAVFEPVEIDGTEVSRASLYNISVMKDTFHGQGWKGQKIKVVKRNQIIPKIEWAEVDVETEKEYLNIPSTCPICGGDTIINDNDGVLVLKCGNPQCSGLLVNRIEHMFGRGGLDAKGISKATIGKLIDWGWVSSISDMFTLSRYKRAWANKEGFGEKSVDNIIRSIESSSNCNLESIISGAGIPLIGRTVARDIAARYDTYASFKKDITGDFDFSSINGFGYEMNKALKNFDYTELDYIVENYLTIKEKEKIVDNSNKLENLTFVITGKLNKEGQFKNRDTLKAFIEKNGGKVASAVSKNTNYLIANQEENTTKYNNAKALGISLITEEEFKNIFDL